MDKNYYITTPVYYPSAKPHMGHAYSSIMADFFARFKRIDGFDVHFLSMVLKFKERLKKTTLNHLHFVIILVKRLEICQKL